MIEHKNLIQIESLFFVNFHTDFKGILQLNRIFAILLAFIYLIPAIGISVNKHYCGGKLASVDIGIGHKDNCPCGNKPMKKGCCKNETQFFKFKQPSNSIPHVELKFESNDYCLIPNYSDFKQEIYWIDICNK
ncbi:MAG: hypothetical protein EBY31_03365, partial [Flavobacteriia bacterium]|nr:hypothetical protein [Flavobacteriia bacterium]